ncbi:uncharacterized protein K460DRAFT_379131 [Cucurbitaria berberidis CBS 394.84]|uniref:C6 transcription factor n=1 Tax=Cucurbitaria berberidis CBS 394.84 TaxID=1168544 RepID=A0A9P4GF77_9PLEO|nr:uncharacterized protein K460DRAFT_379131 [Cucurbitaria berberidis CBS 394.84]KAF1844134.1 hypothetical protein K460DRAFT_379131 [Cucurbitaria berberidis CBS 394.84]
MDATLTAQAAWREALPLLGTKYRFVTHGILAIASLHLSRLAGTEKEQQMYQDIAATQMNTGLTQYRVEVQNMTTKNAEALFAFSTTTTTFVLHTAGAECEATLRSIRRHDLSIEETLGSISALSKAICRILRSIRGVLVIIVPCWDCIYNGPLRPITDREWWPAPVPVTAEELDENRKLQRLETMWSRHGRNYNYSFHTLRHALKDLREAFALVSRLRCLAQSGDTRCATSFDWTSVFSWPVQLSLEFMALLEQRCMEAWVLIAHYAILLSRVTGVMWLDGLAANLIATAALVIGEDNWAWVEWPATATNMDLTFLRNLAKPSPQTHTSMRETTAERPTESLQADSDSSRS